MVDQVLDDDDDDHDGAGGPEMPDERAAMAGIAAVVRTADGLRRRWAADGRVGLSEVRAMFRLLEGGSLSPHELGDSLDLGSGAMTALLDRLERDGFTRRTPHPSDRRRLVIELTEQGRAMTVRWRSVYENVIGNAVSDTTPEEREAVIRFLNRVAEGTREASANSQRP